MYSILQTHTATYITSFRPMREEHMLSPQSDGRACCTLSGKHADDDVLKLSRTSGALLVLPDQTVYRIGRVSDIHRCVPNIIPYTAGYITSCMLVQHYAGRAIAVSAKCRKSMLYP